MIQLDGLTPLQQELADRIWHMDTREEIVAWVMTMPRSVAQQAWIVMQMIIAAQIDEAAELDVTEARAVLDRIRSC